MKVFKIDEYVSVQLQISEQYGVDLIQGRMDKEGNFKPSFCTRKFGKAQVEKTAPVSVKLGNTQTAISVLSQILQGLQSGKKEPVQSDDVPF